MKYFLILTLTLITFSYSSIAGMIMPTEEQAKANIEKAYFIGLVNRVYNQQWPDGTFKEAGLKPFIVYKANPDINFDDLIIITRGDAVTSWDVLPQSGISEVLIMEVEGKLKLVRLSQINYGDNLKELRKKARYAGEPK